MSTDAFLSMFPGRDDAEPVDPMKAAQGSLRQALPKRFYSVAGTELHDGAWRLILDGRPARTPAKRFLAAGDHAVALALAAEWQAQGEVINPAAMPLTRLLNAAIDGVALQAEAVRDEIERYAGNDLICYRAEAPQELAQLQSEAWGPLLAWVEDVLGASLMTTSGIVHAAQPAVAIAALRQAVDAVAAPVPLAALSLVTTLTGSAVIALALAHGAIDADAAWSSAHVDEDYQSRVWGADDEAIARHAGRRRDFDAAALVLASARLR